MLKCTHSINHLRYPYSQAHPRNCTTKTVLVRPFARMINHAFAWIYFIRANTWMVVCAFAHIFFFIDANALMRIFYALIQKTWQWQKYIWWSKWLPSYLAVIIHSFLGPYKRIWIILSALLQMYWSGHLRG